MTPMSVNVFWVCSKKVPTFPGPLSGGPRSLGHDHLQKPEGGAEDSGCCQKHRGALHELVLTYIVINKITTRLSLSVLSDIVDDTYLYIGVFTCFNCAVKWTVFSSSDRQRKHTDQHGSGKAKPGQQSQRHEKQGSGELSFPSYTRCWLFPGGTVPSVIHSTCSCMSGLPSTWSNVFISLARKRIRI